MIIAVLGANGYIGHNLIKQLLAETNHSIVALSMQAESMPLNDTRLSKHNVDVFDTEQLRVYLKNCDAAYYLIHMMAQNKLDFAEAESLAAKSFCTAAEGSALKRVIFLGGLGNDNEKLSKHLASRHKTGQILKNGLPLVIEFRASMVIGDGSISYDIIVNLIHKLPILTLPKWAKTLTQPIGLNDALSYLIAAIDLKTSKHQIVEIGGPEQLSYGDLMKRYAAWRNKKMLIVKLHVIPVSVAAWWLNLFTPRIHAKVGRIMVESLSNPMLVTNNVSSELFPEIKPKSLEEVFV
ncbi:NAD-dependent epimerase/dehydratase family protein [bacterium]|nr:NAD-dependent epimerase/dehydratase family protein [bacterium]NBX97690.1 NAD-dependent epimerase/dehydratase family protein [bacterium]NDC94512.1 NAD-dependent epimerase/dehydratase family protein [bacterium]NDD83160.1 NAD-dependent epimerase/dehydratase family protein [bacterium]NDG29619.1 NAD-dependent epimerase/dehydratase family protein [bacterium]